MTRNQTASQAVVAVAMGVVVSAAAVALYQHAGLPGPVAATAALAAYLLLLTVHGFAWRRGNRPAMAKPVDRREQELRRLNEKARRPAGPPAAGHAAPAPAFGQALAKAPPPMPSMQPAPRAPLPPQQRPAPFPAGTPFAADPEPALPPLPPRQPERAAPPPLPAAQQAGSTGKESLDDFWSFRPAANEKADKDKKLPPFVTGRAGRPPEPTLPVAPPSAPAKAAAAAAVPPLPPRPEVAAPAAAANPREADVEVIQDAIKRLLEEVNAAEQHQARAAAPPPLPQRTAATHAAQSIAETSIEHSVDALRMTAGSMRSAIGAPAAYDADAFAPPPAPPRAQVPAPQPPPLPPFVRQAAPRPTSPSDALARQMADAISAGRIDVALEPILGLEDQQTRHYEVTVRLRDADGNPLTAGGDGPDLRGTGLLPLFDGVRITRTAAVARRLEERGKGGSVFSTFSGESVADEHFLGELAETLHQRSSLATQLVLSFTQSDVRGFSTPEWDSLADMRALGFRFAMSHITDLDMDFEALAEQGFAFVKLDASVFLEGLRAPSGHLPSSDVCRHLAKHGLTLVVEHIDNDEQLARVFGFGVLLGQGQLFGGPRPVRADVVSANRGGARTAAA
jgi:cyclic-di-GMP phosphodiesterase TipF (flagellum assembly factor)